MTAKIEQLAKMLASRNYAIELIKDDHQEEGYIYLALNPELQGCMAQGKTIDEAIINLNEARFDFIYSLLKDNLVVPQPIEANSCTTLEISDNVTSNVSFIQESINVDKSKTARESEKIFQTSLFQISNC